MQARLKVIQENANLKQVKLLPVTVIGRAAECQLKIASTQVSRRHCRITVTDKEVLIEDLNSANGTYVNQDRLIPGKPTVVQPGTTLHIGPAAFVVDYTPPLTLETMPTTVIKSSELPFLQGRTAENPAIVESGMANPPAVTDQITETAPEKHASAEPASDMVGSDIPAQKVESEASAAPSDSACPEFLSPSPPDERRPVAAAPAVATPVPVMPGASSRGTERKTVRVDDPPKEKPAAEVPTAAVVMSPAAPAVRQPSVSMSSSEQTVRMQSPGEETMAEAPPPVSPTVAGAAFDFLANPKGRSPAQSPATVDCDNFDFTSAPSPVSGKPAETVSKSAASKKSLFGLFGKKEKPAAAAPAPAPSVVVESTPEQPASAADTSFEFFDKPTPVFPPQAVNSAPTAPPDDDAAAPEDPFAFLK